MKRFLTLMTAIIMATVAMAQSAGIVLSYNKGKELKFYSADQLANAIKDAEVNDTIYFSSGEYDLTCLSDHHIQNVGSRKAIPKPLVFIGSGAKKGSPGYTRLFLVDELFITVEDSVEESKRNFSFEGMHIDVISIRPYSNMNELKFVNVSSKFSDTNMGSKKIESLIIDRCYFDALYLSIFATKHAKVNNTMIVGLSGGCSEGVFVLDHCCVGVVSSSFVGLIKHSLIDDTSAGQKTSFENCGIRYNRGSASMTDCIDISSSAYELDDNPSFLGKCKDDGTAYGTSGGETPFTLNVQYPTPDTSVDDNTGKAKSYVDYDAINKKLTITVVRVGE